MMRSVLLAALALLLVAAGPAAAHASREDAVFHTPAVLDAKDVRLYRALFVAARSARPRAVRKLAAKLTDRSLMGYVEAQRFLSPKAKHITLAQLTGWLDLYGDLPVAAQVRDLAEHKNSHGRVEIAALPTIRKRGGGYEEFEAPETPLVSDAARAAQSTMETAIQAGQPAQAQPVLQALVAAGSAPASDIARLIQRLVASYLAQGQDQAGLQVALTVADSDRAAAPLLDWYQALADYRLGQYAYAAKHFEQLAARGSIPSHTRSAAAFWAARAHLQAGDPLPVVTLLGVAAREQPTFYGLLAERLLGQSATPGFAEPVLDANSFAVLMTVPAAHRAVALWQIGETQYVGGEMDHALTAIDLHQGPAYAALARRLDLPNLELRACETAASRGIILTGLFPVPRYAPPGGYHVDRSLVLAFARAESRFQSDAVSAAGARGLMQIMPATAAHLDGAPPSDSKIEDPVYNLDVGQRYLRQLLTKLDGNLIELAAAYNAGPNALARWRLSRAAMREDPLLFIESLPAPQTRLYVKRVLTYYWMYARRSDAPAPTLDQMARGQWPKYLPADAHVADAPAGSKRVRDAAALH
jgi:soluble lytic murein transglycosylase-like protein